MCGIFAYTGKRNATPLLIEGLRALEYRGYDSAGVYLEGVGTLRAVGEVENLAEKCVGVNGGLCGIAHTRWATHGEATEANAHPHTDCSRDVVLVHNGIIENHTELREQLENTGHLFHSKTDSEVLAHLIEVEISNGASPEQAVEQALDFVEGTYGIAVAFKQQPGMLVTARKGSPIVIGVGDNECFIASDAAPVLKHTKRLVYLNDGEMATVFSGALKLSKAGAPIERVPEIVEWNPEHTDKGGYQHSMLKEIMEGPSVVRKALKGRLLVGSEDVNLGELKNMETQLSKIEHIVIVGCGTALYSGAVAQYLLEEYTGIPVEVCIASEFRYKNPIIKAGTLLIAVSQSGETLDTLEALREGKRRGALTLGIVNTVGSTIARETDAVIYNHAGPEIGVASTKAFISQLSVFALLAIFLSKKRGFLPEKVSLVVQELALIPEKIERVLLDSSRAQAVAEHFASAKNFLYIGRKYSNPIAFEGALKLKEISYIHAEGCSAGEMKHGPIAMIDEQFPTFAIAPKDSVYQKMLSNIQEIKARKGRVVAIATEGDIEVQNLVDEVLYIPPTIEALSPILSVVQLQLFAYYVARAKGLNVDKPRNLAKSVTVE